MALREAAAEGTIQSNAGVVVVVVVVVGCWGLYTRKGMDAKRATEGEGGGGESRDLVWMRM